jgi:two-component system response regulator YesN
LAEAQKLLEGGSLIVQDISKAVGFMTEQSFYRFFKKETGITPQEYRERHTLSKSDNQK